MIKNKKAGRLRGWFGLRRARRSTAETRAISLPPMSRGQQFFAMLVVFALGVALTAFLLVDPLDLIATEQPQGQVPATAAGGAVPQQLYQCPMHPEVIEAQTGSCPICEMKLMPIESGATGGGDVAQPNPSQEHDDKSAAGRTIEIDPVQVQNTGVVSRPARRGEIARTLRTVGILDFNADLITWVNTKFSGWIEKVHSSRPRRNTCVRWSTRGRSRGANGSKRASRRRVCCARHGIG